ncbi:type IV pilus secretin PilQ [Geotalea sp. SG265]|uniref:type IV pilus secretin PilQ n=1 Tax=Geotalea sp. SG265 TaxID=2922867 RepID=UPI001FAF0C17|nr:type IV pilus secretin PilQ [Geotalea sp. SG265]
MKMSSFRIICHALILIFLMALSGCAKKMVAAKDVEQYEANSSAVIQGITIKQNGSQAEIVTNKPLTYTSYKTNDPPKIFIDLAQTEPGQIKPVTSETGSIKSIRVTRQDFGSGFLSRVEIDLRHDADFSVRTDANDKGKLHVALASRQAEEKNAKAEEDQPAVSEPEKTAGAAKALVNVAPDQTPTAEGATGEPKEDTARNTADTEGDKGAKGDGNTATQDKPTSNALKVLSAINVLDDRIDLTVAGSPVTFTSFKLDKPGRLVMDLFEIKNEVKSNPISINRFGIAKARVGTSPGKVRIVFDAAKDKVPAYRIDKSDSGVSIIFSEVAGEPAAHKQPAASESPKVASENKRSGAEKGTVESIDFKLIDGFSRVEIKTAGACTVDKPAETSKGILLSFKNCELPRKLQRTLDTKAFASSVLSVTPYQVKVAGGINARVLVKLRSKSAYSDRMEGRTYVFEVKNPIVPAVISGPAKDKAAPAPKIEDELLAAPSNGSGAAELPKSVVTKQQPKKIYTGRKVTLEFSDADIRKIFQLIAEVSNLNFLIADDVTGTISIKLVNVPWDQALDVILDTKGLGMIREGNIVQIKPKAKMQSQSDEELAAKKARERGMELRTEIFDVNYAAVADIATQFGTLKSERGIVSTDVRTNRVIVKDIATAIDDMRMLLKNLDTPEKQVMIEARIVEASTSFVRDLGVQWGIHYVDGSASVAGISRLDTGFGGQVVTAPTSGTSGPGAAVGMSFGKLASNIQLDMRLSAAVTADQIKIMSTPRVVTLNNKPAKISQGASIPYQTTSAEGTKTEFVEAALTLEVTPHITSDGSIGMKIKASNNSAGAGTPPPINKKEATTELLVKNGETTVIGGIYVDSDTESDKGVPFLQDIPLLGWLFKSNTKNKTKNELLIFITPKIVS